jgi:hypothetical protein
LTLHKNLENDIKIKSILDHKISSKKGTTIFYDLLNINQKDFDKSKNSTANSEENFFHVNQYKMNDF